jgi:hypothetical protein
MMSVKILKGLFPFFRGDLKLASNTAEFMSFDLWRSSYVFR